MIEPLQRTIAHLRKLVQFVEDYEVSNEEASAIFEDIMEKMLEDIDLCKHDFTAVPADGNAIQHVKVCTYPVVLQGCIVSGAGRYIVAMVLRCFEMQFSYPRAAMCANLWSHCIQ